MARELVDMGGTCPSRAATSKTPEGPEVIQAVPMDRLMIETDAPYLTPVPYRGRRNDSTYVHLVAEKIAQLRGMTRQRRSRHLGQWKTLLRNPILRLPKKGKALFGQKART